MKVCNYDGIKIFRCADMDAFEIRVEDGDVDRPIRFLAVRRIYKNDDGQPDDGAAMAAFIVRVINAIEAA